MQRLTLILGVVLLSYSSVGIVSETWFQNDEKVEGILCRFFLCRNTVVVRAGHQQLWDGDLQRAIDAFRRGVQRDAGNPFRWAELGEAFFEAGERAEARYCFGRVEALAPYRPTFLLRAAYFHFQAGEPERALPITARILKSVSEYDAVIFSQYTRLVDNVEDVLRYGMPEDRRAAQSYLRHLIRAGRLSDAQQTWDWAAARHLADDAVAGEYVQFLIEQRRPREATTAWVRHLGVRAGDYPKSNHLFNGDFESEPVAAPFDWRIRPAEGVEVTRDSNAPWSGGWSLRIRFSGTANLTYGGVLQTASVEPGAYRFQAYVRTEGVTTDEGIRFRIFDGEAPEHLNLTTRQFSGTTPWTTVQRDFIVPPMTRIVQVVVIRQPSMKFDNKISGTVWIDAMKLVRGGP